MSRRRVVVTGVGAVSPLGHHVETLWTKLLAGESGIGLIDQYDVSSLPVQIAGTIKSLNLDPYLSPKEARKVDPFIQYAVVASGAAIEDAGLVPSEMNPERIGCCIGSGIGGLTNIEAQHKVLLKSGPKRVSPFFVTGSVSNMASGMVSIRYGLKGPSYAVVTACASGTHNIGLSARMIQYGDADIMVAGGAEKGSCELGMAAFASARALSKRNDDPEKASRPWDKARDGFVLSDGAGVMVLEEYEHARRRNAPIYAELIGFGASSDAFHITAPPEGGAGAAMAMQNALADAGVEPEKVGYINAHGTSTPAGDVAEVAAIKHVFGAAASTLAISSTKSMLGHMLAAAGAVEAIVTVMALKHQAVPPTINLENPDEGCDLDFVANLARKCSVQVAMSNSFGFGGTNGSLLFARPS